MIVYFEFDELVLPVGKKHLSYISTNSLNNLLEVEGANGQEKKKKT